jgi:Phage integrase, N-terminal SAM-like domain
LGPADDALEVGADVLTFAEAQEKARQWFVDQARKATGEPESSQALTVADVVNVYLDWTKIHRRPSTAREWRYMANAHILPALGKVEVAKLTTTRLRMWHEGLPNSLDGCGPGAASNSAIASATTIQTRSGLGAPPPIAISPS